MRWRKRQILFFPYVPCTEWGEIIHTLLRFAFTMKKPTSSFRPALYIHPSPYLFHFHFCRHVSHVYVTFITHTHTLSQQTIQRTAKTSALFSMHYHNGKVLIFLPPREKCRCFCHSLYSLLTDFVSLTLSLMYKVRPFIKSRLYCTVKSLFNESRFNVNVSI